MNVFPQVTERSLPGGELLAGGRGAGGGRGRARRHALAARLLAAPPHPRPARAAAAAAALVAPARPHAAQHRTGYFTLQLSKHSTLRWN